MKLHGLSCGAVSTLTPGIYFHFLVCPNDNKSKVPFT